MSKALEIPKTLLEIIRFFGDEQRAFECVRDQRWPDGKIACPLCGSQRVKFMASVRRWNCNGCRKQFSAKTGTIFEESPIAFSKWLPAMWLLVNAKNGISSYELHRALGVTQKTGWFMLHRIRLAIQNGTIDKIGGHVEVDETFIGGKARNMHKHIKAERIKVRGGSDKTVVLGMLERGGEVRTWVVGNREKPTLNAVIKANLEKGSNLYSDAWAGYADMSDWFKHQVVDHAEAYVDGVVHTNGMENFWALLKRGLHGTYVSVEPFHLFRYLDEQAFRFNERYDDDRGRFLKALSQVVDKRVTYRELTGKMECPPAS